MNLYEDQFSEDYHYPKVSKPAKILIIASTGRCGSHMLGHALHETKKFGFPLEYANFANLKEWEKRLNVDGIQQVIAKLKMLRTSPNGVFGIKIHYSQIEQFGNFESLLRYLPNAYYILLSRKNVLKQAVSLSIASQTGVWISGQKPINDNITYDFEEIDSCLRSIIRDNSSWRYTLSANGCNYIEMDFDHVRHDLPNSIKRIANFVGCEIDEADIPDTQITKKQSNEINKEWERKYLLEIDKNSELFNHKSNKISVRIKSKIKQLLYA